MTTFPTVRLSIAKPAIRNIGYGIMAGVPATTRDQVAGIDQFETEVLLRSGAWANVEFADGQCALLYLRQLSRGGTITFS